MVDSRAIHNLTGTFDRAGVLPYRSARCEPWRPGTTAVAGIYRADSLPLLPFWAIPFLSTVSAPSHSGGFLPNYPDEKRKAESVDVGLSRTRDVQPGKLKVD